MGEHREAAKALRSAELEALMPLLPAYTREEIERVIQRLYYEDVRVRERKKREREVARQRETEERERAFLQDDGVRFTQEDVDGLVDRLYEEDVATRKKKREARQDEAERNLQAVAPFSPADVGENDPLNMHGLDRLQYLHEIHATKMEARQRKLEQQLQEEVQQLQGQSVHQDTELLEDPGQRLYESYKKMRERADVMRGAAIKDLEVHGGLNQIHRDLTTTPEEQEESCIRLHRNLAREKVERMRLAREQQESWNALDNIKKQGRQPRKQAEVLDRLYNDAFRRRDHIQRAREQRDHAELEDIEASCFHPTGKWRGARSRHASERAKPEQASEARARSESAPMQRRHAVADHIFAAPSHRFQSKTDLGKADMRDIDSEASTRGSPRTPGLKSSRASCFEDTAGVLLEQAGEEHEDGSGAEGEAAAAPERELTELERISEARRAIFRLNLLLERNRTLNGRLVYDSASLFNAVGNLRTEAKDASVSLDALESGLRRLWIGLTPDQAQHARRYLDRNRDGTVTREEFVERLATEANSLRLGEQLLRFTGLRRWVNGSLVCDAQSLFQAMDSDRDGRLSRAEVGTRVIRFGVTLSPPQVSAVFRLLSEDRSGSGMITKDAWVAWLDVCRELNDPETKRTEALLVEKALREGPVGSVSSGRRSSRAKRTSGHGETPGRAHEGYLSISTGGQAPETRYVALFRDRVGIWMAQADAQADVQPRLTLATREISEVEVDERCFSLVLWEGDPVRCATVDNEDVMPWLAAFRVMGVDVLTVEARGRRSTRGAPRSCSIALSARPSTASLGVMAGGARHSRRSSMLSAAGRGEAAALSAAIAELYKGLSPTEDADAALGVRQLQRYAVLLGFEGSDAEWIAEYESWCKRHGLDVGAAVNIQQFSQLVSGHLEGSVKDGLTQLLALKAMLNSRLEMIGVVFWILDPHNTGRLGSWQMRQIALRSGFSQEGTLANMQWGEKYSGLCGQKRVRPSTGMLYRHLVELLDDPDSVLFMSSKQLKQLVADLQSRAHLISEIAHELASDADAFGAARAVKEKHIRRCADLLGVVRGGIAWHRQYVEMCLRVNLNPSGSIDLKGFDRLMSNQQSSMYCTDLQLMRLLAGVRGEVVREALASERSPGGQMGRRPSQVSVDAAQRPPASQRGGAARRSASRPSVASSEAASRRSSIAPQSGALRSSSAAPAAW